MFTKIVNTNTRSNKLNRKSMFVKAWTYYFLCVLIGPADKGGFRLFKPPSVLNITTNQNYFGDFWGCTQTQTSKRV